MLITEEPETVFAFLAILMWTHASHTVAEQGGLGDTWMGKHFWTPEAGTRAPDTQYLP